MSLALRGSRGGSFSGVRGDVENRQSVVLCGSRIVYGHCVIHGTWLGSWPPGGIGCRGRGVGSPCAETSKHSVTPPGFGLGENVEDRLLNTIKKLVRLPIVSITMKTEEQCLKEFIKERCRVNVKVFMQRALKELECSTVLEGRPRYPMLFSHPVFSQLIEWINERIRLKGIKMEKVTMAMFCPVMGIMLMYHATGVSVSHNVQSLRKHMFTSLRPETVSRAHNHMTYCNPSLQGKRRTMAWLPLRDMK